ncbi:hypothetical protein GWN63_04390 [Candidatus Bathyarchaeota archaeon]|nr:hypothetical protein [Candidatus Bathyarchaeota archaeon]NIU81466.1 hypothetical protein [Candidatus Bathyarchaeota archaeon]NIW16022.1 hypothetical protein [Candidatus Bathyarchaeota archaeon]
MRPLIQREEIQKEMVDTIGDNVSKETAAQKVEQFMKHGNVFLFYELINLRKELETLKSKMTNFRQSGSE